MMKQVVIFSMESCPFCTLMKDMLNENQIPFIDMDIDKHVEDYEMFKELVDGNDFVPAVMIIDESKTRKITPFALTKSLSSS